MIAQLVERTPVKRRVAGSSPARAAIFARVAQAVEQSPCKGKVVGAKPTSGLLSCRLIGKTSPFEGEYPGSNPGDSELWFWSSS